MSKRLLVVAFALGLVTAACSKPPQASVTFGSGTQFVPQVADFLDNVGLGSSVAVGSDGTPYVSYFGFPQEVPKGQVATPRPIGSPSLPGVLLASVKNGIWTRGAVAMQAQIPSVSIPFGPAIVPQVKSMTPQNVNGTAIAVDGSGGLHVAWAADTGLWYASNGGGSFSADRLFKISPALTAAGPLGAPSIAVGSDGTPWVAYTVTTATGQEVRVATGSNGSWTTEVAATVPLTPGGPQPVRTEVALSNGQPLVVFSDGTNVLAATRTVSAGRHASARAWSTHTVESGAEGVGLSLASASDGTIHVAYYTGTEVHEASSRDGVSWRVTKVADVGSGQNEAGRSTGVAIDSAGTTYVAWYDPGTDGVRLASGSGGQFQTISVQDTAGGDLPSLGVTADGSAVYVAWYDEVDQNLMLGTYGNVASLELAVPSPTPTGVPTSAPSPSAQCTQAQNGTVSVTASGIAFDTNCIEVPAWQPFTIAFDNKDAGIPHNIAIYPSSTQLTPADALFQGEIVTGPTTTQYKVSALDAGTYYFHCDVHPTMNGTFKVVTSSGGGGTSTGGGASGGGGLTTAVTASGMAFDVTTITLKANTATTITFDNKDAGIPHNIAIYPSSSELTSPLFRGDIVTGPATATYTIPPLKPGTYYFQCDVHPTVMNGQVVVK